MPTRSVRTGTKFDHDGAAIERLFVDVFLDAHCEPPIRIEIDLDATDDPLYSQQEDALRTPLMLRRYQRRSRTTRKPSSGMRTAGSTELRYADRK